MIEFQENVVAGHSTGVAWLDKEGMHIRKAVGKMNSFLAEYPDKPNSNTSLGHSRYATIGAITKENQHPISVLYHGRRIGYAIHNGTFRQYAGYEYLRKGRLTNETDSAVLFALYSTLLEKMGDSSENRRRAMAYIMKMLGDTGNANVIIMFRNGQVLFSGNNLTYKKTEDAVGVMTFGFQTHTEQGIIYQVKGFEVQKFRLGIPAINIPEKFPEKKTPSKINESCSFNPEGVYQSHQFNLGSWMR